MDGGPISFEIVSELSDTDRGDGGFGSTGKWFIRISTLFDRVLKIFVYKDYKNINSALPIMQIIINRNITN